MTCQVLAAPELGLQLWQWDTFLLFPRRVSDLFRAGLGMCPLPGSFGSSGVLRAVAADQWQPRETREAPGIVAKPQGTQEGSQAMCAL